MVRARVRVRVRGAGSCWAVRCKFHIRQGRGEAGGGEAGRVFEKSLAGVDHTLDSTALLVDPDECLLLGAGIQ